MHPHDPDMKWHNLIKKHEDHPLQSPYNSWDHLERPPDIDQLAYLGPLSILQHFYGLRRPFSPKNGANGIKDFALKGDAVVTLSE